MDHHFIVWITVAKPIFNFHSSVAQIGTDMTSYTVNEFNQDLWFEVTIVNPPIQKAPGQSCDIQVSTVDATAIGEQLRIYCGTCSSLSLTNCTPCRWSGLCTTQQNCHH